MRPGKLIKPIKVIQNKCLYAENTANNLWLQVNVCDEEKGWLLHPKTVFLVLSTQPDVKTIPRIFTNTKWMILLNEKRYILDTFGLSFKDITPFVENEHYLCK